MKIIDVLFSKGTAGFYFDDQLAIRAGAGHDGFLYTGEPLTAGFEHVRMAGESASIMIVLEDGQIAVGDCAAVQYSGAAGRDPLFLADRYIPVMEEHLRPLWKGAKLESFRSMTAALDQIRIDGRPLHTAVLFGASLAILDAVARATKRMPCEVLCDEFGLPLVADPVPLFGQSGDNRYECVDKMVLKGVDVLPHGLFNTVEDKLGRDGSGLREYLRWLVARIQKIRRSDAYQPDLHIDVYGTIGLAFGQDVAKAADFIASLEEDADGMPLYIEGPIDLGSLSAQIEGMAELKSRLGKLGSTVKTVADEWCNTFADVRAFADADACHMVQIKAPDLGGIQHSVESIIYCRENGVGAYQGGTCNETDISARLCVHSAMAARADRFLCKPGMGFDEGFMIAKNEMARIAAIVNSRAG